MTLVNLRAFIRGRIPAAKIQTINNTLIDLLLNNAVIDIAAYTACLPTNKKFNAVAEQAEYSLSSVIGDFLTADKPGLWWNAGSAAATDYKKLDPSTQKGLDENWPTRRDLASDDPQAYSIDGDILTLVPKPSASLADAFWLYYGKKPGLMTQDDFYPFSGSTTEFTHLSIFDEAIILYAMSKISPMVNEKADAQALFQDYLNERERQYMIYRQRKDLVSSGSSRFQGPMVRR